MKKQYNVLIIDDSQDDRESYCRLLRKDSAHTWTISEAETGEEGLEKYQSGEFSCVLLDYSLPGRDGLKVLSDIQEHDTYAAAVMLTGQGNESIAVECMRNGAQNYLVKSDITSKILQNAVSNAIERVEMMNKIREQKEQLETFSHLLVHDLKEPVHMVRSFLKFISEAIEEKNYEEIESYYECVDKSANHMVQLIDTLAEYNKIEAANVFFEPVSMKTIVETALNNLDLVMKEKNAKVTYDELPVVVGNTPQLVQLIQNLIGNGMRYCTLETPTIHISGKEVEGGWQLSLKDNGIGIDKKFHHAIFDPFRRLHGTYEYSGVGLGLATCKKVIERHRGKIWCESEVGKGTTFHFTLMKGLPVSDK